MEVSARMSESDFRFDKRVIEWCLQAGQLDQKEYERHLKELKDTADNAVACDINPILIKKPMPARSLQEDEEL